MLRRLDLKNFKSAQDLTVRLSALTILAGLNGSGKSTVLQALALLKQSMPSNGLPTHLILRGALVQLGRTEDVQSENGDGDTLTLGMSDQTVSAMIEAKFEKGADLLVVGSDSQDTNDLLTKYLTECQFIPADRLTPATQYAQGQTGGLLGRLGPRGEFTVDYLQRYGDSAVSGRRSFPRAAIGVTEQLLRQVAPTDKLIDQVAGWLQQLSPGVRLASAAIDYADAVSLRFQYTGIGIDSTSRQHRPTNVGFGLTYCLPILVACLTANAGSLLLLENPEAHLHPQGQAALGRLLAQTAADGVQVIVETHSDHLLNGVRVAVKQAMISSDAVSLQFFSRDIESGASQVQSPQIMDDGQLMEWPVGFFDQWDKSLDELLA